MASRSLADRLRLILPALLTLLLMLLVAVPLPLTSLPLAPHALWLMTLTVAVAYPPAWTPVTAFALGLLGDLISGTPLGSQALLTLLATLGAQSQARRLAHQLFRVRWMEAAGALFVLHFVLWAIIGWVGHATLPMKPVAIAAAVSSLWYPLFYLLTDLLTRLLPPRN